MINEGHSYFCGKCRVSYKSVTRYLKYYSLFSRHPLLYRDPRHYTSYKQTEQLTLKCRFYNRQHTMSKLVPPTNRPELCILHCVTPSRHLQLCCGTTVKHSIQSCSYVDLTNFHPRVRNHKPCFPFCSNRLPISIGYNIIVF